MEAIALWAVALLFGGMVLYSFGFAAWARHLKCQGLVTESPIATKGAVSRVATAM